MFETLSDRLAAALKKVTGKGVLRPEDVELALRDVRLALLEADVHYKVVKEFSERVRGRAVGAEVTSSLAPAQQVVKIVHEELVQLLGGNSAGLAYSPSGVTVVMLVGLQGSGKTTTAVKLALLARKEGRRPMVVALDLRRPAAVEQLRVLAAQQQVGFFSWEGDPERIAAAALAAAGGDGRDFLVLDTAGRSQVDEELMEELVRIKASVPVTETLLVADAMTGQEAVNVGAAFRERPGVDGVVLTKLDGDARGGAALSLRMATGQQVRFAGVGERPGDLEVFHADRMASRILGMGDVLTLIERAERNLDQEAARQVERNLRAGHLTFDDFLLQIRQLKGMGSLDSVLEMLPGAGPVRSRLGPEGAQDASAEVARMEAIIQSMTARERARPEIIDGSRRRRIARGSGTSPADVNRVLKGREAMQQMVKQLTRGQARRTGLAGWGKLFG
jgi:signal recognition particle subunit SRP54